MTTIKDYLRLNIKITKQNNMNKLHGYYSMEDFVYKNGQSFKARKLPKNIKLGTMKECYRNAALLAIDNAKYYYVEGYALGVIPVMHAWCIDKNKCVIDPTWPDGKEYFGVVFKKTYLFKYVEKYKRYNIIDNYQHRWPLLKLNKNIWREII